MRKLLTTRDVKILQALSEFGPRNLSKISRLTHIPRYTLDFRIKRMQSDPRIFLRMHASVYHTKIGLKKAFAFVEAEPGMEQALFDCLKANSFWLYICRSYGIGEGCTAIYAVPVEHSSEFEEFIYDLKRVGVAKNVQLYWSTCFQGGRITSDWFDNQQEKWVFHWDDWMREIPAQSVDLPYTLVEPKSYPINADEIDIQMLMKLEGDGTRTIEEIAKFLGMSRQRVHFHYKRHVTERNLIEGYEVFVMRYGDSPFFMAYFIVSFHDYETYAKFANSLLDKFFVITMGKMLGENSLMVEVFLPTQEFRKFVDALSKLARKRLVKSYKYAIQDITMMSRQTFSGEYFKGHSWVYDHKGHMEALQRKVSAITS